MEAEKYLKKGNKAVSTGLFKWSSDHSEGAMFFEKAAKIFKAAGRTDKAIECYLKYSKSNEKINEFYGAG